MDDLLIKIMRAPNSVFSYQDLFLLGEETDPIFLKNKIYRYVKSSKLFALRKGLYAKDKTFDPFELATKIYTPSYVSFETVLKRAGIVFQFYSQIFCASYLSREIKIQDQIYSYQKIKEAVLTNTLGIDCGETYALASPERAFLDVLYLNKDYFFDNLSPLNWKKVFEILPIYKNKRMEKIVTRHYKEFLKESEPHQSYDLMIQSALKAFSVNQKPFFF